MVDSQQKRITQELKAVGVGSVGLRMLESKALVGLLHPSEHIGGVVYGRYAGGIGMLVATDQRVIFLDRKPGFATSDELTYDVVSGVSSMTAGPFSSVTLKTRITNYIIRFVAKKPAKIFVEFIEKRRLEDNNQATPSPQSTPDPANEALFLLNEAGEDALHFLRTHDLGVLSTIDRTGNVHGALVYYCLDASGLLYILTRSETNKSRNVHSHSQVSLTISEPEALQTEQVQGFAVIETDQAVKERVYNEIIKPRLYKDQMSFPPVSKIHDGYYIIIRITPTAINYHDYSGQNDNALI